MANKVKVIVPMHEKRVYEFNKNFDLKRVEPASVLLLSEVLASGVVPPDSTDMEFNEIDNPDNIAGRVTNVFDAIDLSRELASSVRSESKAGSTPAQSTTGGNSNNSSTSSTSANVSTTSGD